MKILNLYAGIGGNRKFWTDCQVTAVENDCDIAQAYSHFYPDDKMIICDAHEYLLKNYNRFDFIWSSPPCPTHSEKLTEYSDKVFKVQMKKGMSEIIN